MRHGTILEAADAVVKAVMKVVMKGTMENPKSLSAAGMEYSTSEVGDLVADLAV